MGRRDARPYLLRLSRRRNEAGRDGSAAKWSPNCGALYERLPGERGCWRDENMSSSRRIWDLKFSTGVVFALPIAIVAFWYAWSAYATIDRYRRAADRKQAITLELFQIALYDELTRDLQRILI